MTNVRYTLYCEHGRVLHSRIHYLYIGDWLLPDLEKYVVLVHGLFSKREYLSVCMRYKIGMYSYHPANWTDIRPYHDGKLWKDTRSGWLVRVSANQFKGRLIHNGML